jgi:hypothetical protein
MLSASRQVVTAAVLESVESLSQKPVGRFTIVALCLNGQRGRCFTATMWLRIRGMRIGFRDPDEMVKTVTGLVVEWFALIRKSLTNIGFRFAVKPIRSIACSRNDCIGADRFATAALVSS